MSILNDHFRSELQSIVDYILDSEYDDFMDENSDDVLDDHVYKRALVINSYLGEQDIPKEVAIRLLNSDVADSVMVGNETDGYTELQEGQEISDNDECQLWII